MQQMSSIITNMIIISVCVNTIIFVVISAELSAVYKLSIIKFQHDPPAKKNYGATTHLAAWPLWGE